MPQEKSLPILPVRDTVLFPHAVLPLTVGRESSVQLINSLGEDKTIVVVAQREARVDSPQPSDLYTVGTLAVVHKVVKMPNQSLFVFAEGLERVRLVEFTQLTPFMNARVETVPESIPPKSSEVEARHRRSASENRSCRNAGRCKKRSAERTRTLVPHVADGCRLRGYPKLHRVARCAALGEDVRRRSRHSEG